MTAAAINFHFIILEEDSAEREGGKGVFCGWLDVPPTNQQAEVLPAKIWKQQHVPEN